MSDAELCGHPTTDSGPCKNPTTTDGDPTACWIPTHGGTAATHGERGPHRLTPELIENVTAELEDPRNLVRGVLADHNIPRSTWDVWLKKGKEDLGVSLTELQSSHGDPHHLDEPDTIYGIFLESLARAYDKAIQYLNRMWVDGLVTRKALREVKNEDGDTVDVKVLPKRIDPITEEEIVGEDVRTREVRDYARARFSDIFAEKTSAEIEHSGEVTQTQRLRIPDEALSDPEVQASLETLAGLGEEEDGGGKGGE